MNFKTNFINFVLNEGIMPSILTRMIRSDEELSQNINFIAGILDARQNFNPSVEFAERDSVRNIMQHLKTGIFESDTELSKWLSDVSILLQLIKQDVVASSINIPEEQKQWAVSAFIRSCPLLPDSVKQSYTGMSVEKNDVSLSQDAGVYRRLFGSYLNHCPSQPRIPTDIKSEFYNFITIHDGKSPVTANAYKSALNTIEKKYNVNFWAITDVPQVDSAMNALMADEIFMQNNDNTHGAFVAAMRKYRAFCVVRNYNKNSN